MFRAFRYAAPAAGLVLAGCATAPIASTPAPMNPVATTATAAVQPKEIHWFRNSAEMRGLYLEVYHLAGEELDKLASENAPQTWAVIMDADETLIDNSTFEKELGSAPYTEAAWKTWVDRKAAGALPGTVEFTRLVHRLGGKVVVVTNRDAAYCDATRENLRSDSLDADLVLCRTTTGDKNARFDAVQKGTAAPGFPPLEALGVDRPVVRYDQLGGGHSDRITDTTMFTIPHFVAELDSLRAKLGYDRMHLVGHSWGTILGLEYYRAHPEHVASLTLASSALDIPAWEKYAKHLVTTLPDSEQKTIRIREAEKKFDAPDYQHAIDDFYGRYVWRHPDSVNLDSTFKGANMDIYNYMQGPSEFTIVGTLKHYDATPFLKSVKVPVLYTVGEFDEANPATVKRFANLTPGSKYVVIPGAAHLVTWDNPSATIKAVGDFLRHVDSTSVSRADSAHVGH